MCHLQACSPEPALHIEALVCLGTVQDTLVAADFLRHIVQCLNYPQTKFVALLILSNGDVLDVPNDSKVVNTV